MKDSRGFSADWQPRDEQGRFKETHDDGCPNCGSELSDDKWVGGSSMCVLRCPSCGWSMDYA